ncbi:hypothetical protein SDC9_53701 [bioreactor metagenome]|uniref:FMN-binding domain-containing protein n=1 Tax=bioreactor metagenome TaxID=1076179 RepID=A0A644WTY9_9ZZZZ
MLSCIRITYMKERKVFFMTGEKRKGKRRVWFVLKIIIAVVVVIAAGLGIVLVRTAPGRNELKNMVIDNVDFSKLKDGTYIGEYNGTKDSFRNAKVQVTVKSGKVTDIEVTGGALAGDKQTTKIGETYTIKDLFDRVIKAQSLQVDVITSATLTSKAHLKAVENALEEGPEK